METVLINIAYAVYIASTAFRDVLLLRVTLVASSIAFIVYGIVADSMSVIVWNLVFGAASMYQIWRILQARRKIELSPTEQAVYDTVFSSLSKQDFVYLWEMGEHYTVDGAQIITQGTVVEDLSLLLTGEVAVAIDGSLVAIASPYDFIGEMSLVSGREASATVRANGTVSMRRWNQAQLRGLGRVRPEVSGQLWQILGTNLSSKVNR